MSRTIRYVEIETKSEFWAVRPDDRLKSSSISPNVAHKVGKTVFLKKLCFSNLPIKSPNIWAFLKENLLPKTLKKIVQFGHTVSRLQKEQVREKSLVEEVHNTARLIFDGLDSVVSVPTYKYLAIEFHVW